MAATTENLDAPTKEALQYWGYLFNADKSGTGLLNRLLTGIWNHIGSSYEPSDCPDITPSQLAAFYRAVGGDYDILFNQTPPSTVQFIYKSLGALHSLQPDPRASGYCDPNIPALNRKGYITWQTIQLLLMPGEHGPFLQNAVSKFDIIDPETKQPFPKILPSQSFPQAPDPEMVQWYDNVSERLRKEAAATEQQNAHAAPRASSDFSEDSSADERTAAAEYFRNPQYRNREGRPTIIRRFSQKPRSPREFVQDRTRAVAHTVRHLVNPWTRRHGSLPDKYEDDDLDYEEDRTPTVHTRYAHRRPARRKGSFTSSESEDDDRRPVSPRLRHRRSHEVPASPREYFPPYYEHARRYSVEPRTTTEARVPAAVPTEARPPASSASAEAGYMPSKGPLFATTVAQHYVRPSMQPRGSYSRSTPGRYSVHETSPREATAPTIREPDGYEYRSRTSSHSRRPSREVERERERDRDSDKERQRVHRYVTPVDGVGGRRYAVEQPWR